MEPSSCVCGYWKLALQEESDGRGGQKALAGVLGGYGGESRGRLEFSSAQSARKAIFAGAPGCQTRFGLFACWMLVQIREQTAGS